MSRGSISDRIAPALNLRTAVPAKRVTLRIDRQLAGIDDEGEPVFAPAKTDAADRSVPVGASIAELLAQHLAEHGPGNGGVVFSLTGGQPIDRSRGRAHLAGRRRRDEPTAAVGLARPTPPPRLAAGTHVAEP